MSPGTSTSVSGAAMHLPDTVDGALALLSEHGEDAKLIAGGTAFSILWRSGLLQADHLVACSRLPGLDELSVDGGTVSIGALTTLRDTETSEIVRQHLPVLSSALGHVANLRVRNVATWGGNVAEADNTSDLPCLLAALDAEIRAASAYGTRIVAVDDFFVDYFETALTPEELVVEVRLPVPSPRCRGSYVKFVSRSAEDRTCLGVAAFVEVDEGGECVDARVAVIGAGPVPLRLHAAELQVRGEVLTQSVMRELAVAYVGAADPLSDIRGSAEFRLRVLPELVVQALTMAAAGGNRAVLL